MDPMGLEYLCLFLVYKSKVGERLYIHKTTKTHVSQTSLIVYGMR